MSKRTDRQFLAMAEAVGHIFSKDPSTRVGAIAVGSSNNQVAWGYNGLPPGLADTPERLENRDLKYALTLHAEENALANAPFAVRTLYVTHHPCSGCALRILAKRTVQRVVYAESTDHGFHKRWAANMAEARMLLEEGGVRLEGMVL